MIVIMWSGGGGLTIGCRLNLEEGDLKLDKSCSKIG